MKKAVLFAMVVLSFTACAQRLQQRPGKAGATTEKEADKSKKGDQVLVEKKDVPAAPPSDLEVVKDADESAPKAEASAAAAKPAEKQVDKSATAPVATQESNCSVDFAALSEKDAADVMTKLGGNWIEGGINSVRNVVPSTDTSGIMKAAISLGAKNEEISMSKMTVKLAANVVPGKPAFEVVATTPVAKALSYRVSQEIQGYRLIEIVASNTSGAVQCLTFGLKIEKGPAQAQDAMHMLGPVSTLKLSSDEFFTSLKNKEKIYSRQ